MRRGEVWWADLPVPVGRRPVVLLSRDESYAIRASCVVAVVTTRLRGIPVEVALGPAEGLPKPCVVNVDTLMTIRTQRLFRLIAPLSQHKVDAINAALKFALDLP